MLPLLTTPGQLRRFLLVSAQSSVGSTMGYIALLLVAYDQLSSPWALAAVLTANLLPAALLGPYFGHLADARSRRKLCVGADLACGASYAAIAFSDSFPLTVALALTAGTGAALFRPASRAAIPTLAGAKSDEAVGALVTIQSAGNLIGPAVGAALLLLAPLETLLLVNAATFGLSALVLASLTLDGPRAPEKPWVPMSLDQALAEERFRRRAIREGFAASRRVPRLQLVVVASAGATFALAFGNVGEPLLVTGPLGGGDAAFSLVVAVFGVGATIGALLGAASVRRLIVSILAGAVAMAAIAGAPTLAVALVCFAIGGIVDGVSISCDQRLVTALTPPAILGRAFGLKDSLDAIALLSAYLVSSLIAAAYGPRWVFAASALVVGAVGIGAAVRATREPPAPVPQPAPATTV